MKPRLPGRHDPARKPQRKERAAELGDDTGYCRPPKQTRFKPGQSGNPKGRPKRSRNRNTIVDDVLMELIPVRVDGKERWLSRLEIGFMKAANKVASGDMKVLMQLLAVRTAAAPILDPKGIRNHVTVEFVDPDYDPEGEVIEVRPFRPDGGDRKN